MLKLLIVEDEIGIVALLKNLIQFQKLDLKLVGTAVTGRQALEIMEKAAPDIVITDICMPEMGGLELIEHAKKKGIKAKYVIVSGYSQFDYAVTAIKLGVEDYLLKPINEIELNEVLEKLAFSIQSENDAAHSLKLMNSNVRKQRKKLRKRLFLDLRFNSRSFGERTLEEINADYGYEFREGALFFLGIVKLDGIQDWNMVTKKSLLEQMTRIFEGQAAGCCLEKEACVYNDSFAFLMNVSPDCCPEAEAAIRKIWGLLRELAAQYETVRLTLGRGGPASSCREIGPVFRTAEKALFCRILRGRDKIYSAEDEASPERTLTDQELMKYRMKLQAAVQGGSAQELGAAIRKYLEWILTSSEPAPISLMDNMGRAVWYLLLDLSQQNQMKEDAAGAFRQLKDQMIRCSTKEELLDAISSQILSLLSAGTGSGENDAQIIARVKEYIWAHYPENIRLEDMAAQVYITPGYLGVLFKKETGVTFSAYLIQVRLEKAKELLRDARYNISEVAYAVGYQDVRHFSRLFKEHVGLIPKEYRKLHKNGLY